MYFESSNFDFTLVDGFTKELRDFPQNNREITEQKTINCNLVTYSLADKNLDLPNSFFRGAGEVKFCFIKYYGQFY